MAIFLVDALSPACLVLQLVGLERADVRGGGLGGCVGQGGECGGRGLLKRKFRFNIRKTECFHKTCGTSTCLVPGPVPCMVEVKRCLERTLQRESWLSVSRFGEGGSSLGGLHRSPI